MNRLSKLEEKTIRIALYIVLVIGLGRFILWELLH
jgi:hypothetical protein